MESNELYNRITEVYQKSKSIKKTAEEIGTSVIKVRRVLITEGLWSSPTSKKILNLYNQGLATKDIAKMLAYTEKNVQAYLPYSRGFYGDCQSDDSVRSKEYRERKKQAAENQVCFTDTMSSKIIRKEDLNSNENYGKRPIALKLHLELDITDCSKLDRKILRKYGKIKKSISRDIIVPADMTLHSLHYAIQKLFGWQNSHFHHFSLPEDVFSKLTEGKFSKWCKLAGIYFRFPDNDLYDLYWDDDYQADESFKSWLKSKYKGPYYYGGIGDYYCTNQENIHILKEELPYIEVREQFGSYIKNGKKHIEHQSRTVSIEEATIEEFSRGTFFEAGTNRLLERLTLMEYLYLPDNDYFLDDLNEKLEFLESDYDVVLKLWDMVLSDIENQYEQFCLLSELSTVRMQAQSEQIDYFYDYGDGWKVSITLSNAYYMNDLETNKNPELIEVIKKYSPVCVNADGLPVLDDVGGISGYIDFLLTVYGDEDAEERAQARNWARTLGWTGRTMKPENIL